MNVLTVVNGADVHTMNELRFWGVIKTMLQLHVNMHHFYDIYYVKTGLVI